MLVKLKKEIITMRMPLIQPELGRAPAVEPLTLKRWLDQGHDDAGKPVVMLDTRNAFEVDVDVGTFNDTIDYRIDKFTQFPDVVQAHKDELGGKTVVTFCTGGILQYFEEVGGAHYTGDCFVFDYRTALNPHLEAVTTTACFACRAVVTPREQLSPQYAYGIFFPHCMHR